MDLRNRFVQVSQQLRAAFKIAAATSHMPTRGDAREDALSDFLSNYLPKRYALGSGQVFAPGGRLSKQCDIVLYDPLSGPRLPVSDRASLFPIETVYAVIEVKSDLTKKELEKAYANVASVKSLPSPGSFVHVMQAMSMPVRRAIPWGAVFAYSSSRSLSDLASIVEDRDRDLGNDLHLRPDTVAVLDVGIVAPFPSLRTPASKVSANTYNIPSKIPLAGTRPTGRHTLLRFYLDMLNDLQTLLLEPPRMDSYIDAPEVVDGRVVQQQLFTQMPPEGWDPDADVFKFSVKAIRRLIELMGELPQLTLQDYLAGVVGGPVNTDAIPLPDRERQIYIFNPKEIEGALASVMIDGVEFFFDTDALDESIGGARKVYETIPGINARELFAFAGPLQEAE